MQSPCWRRKVFGLDRLITTQLKLLRRRADHTKKTAPKGRFLWGQRRSSDRRVFRVLHVLFNLVEVQVLVDRRVVLVHDAHGIKVLGHRGDVAQLGRDRRQFGRGQEHVGVLAQAVVEIAGRDGHHRRAFATSRTCVIARAQRAGAVRGPPRSTYSLLKRVGVLSSGLRTHTLKRRSEQQTPFSARYEFRANALARPDRHVFLSWKG